MSRRWGPGVRLPRRWSDGDLLGPRARAIQAANRLARLVDRQAAIDEIVLGRLDRLDRDLADKRAAERLERLRKPG